MPPVDPNTIIDMPWPSAQPQVVPCKAKASASDDEEILEAPVTSEEETFDSIDSGEDTWGNSSDSSSPPK